MGRGRSHPKLRIEGVSLGVWISIVSGNLVPAWDRSLSRLGFSKRLESGRWVWFDENTTVDAARRAVGAGIGSRFIEGNPNPLDFFDDFDDFDDPDEDEKCPGYEDRVEEGPGYEDEDADEEGGPAEPPTKTARGTEFSRGS